MNTTSNNGLLIADHPNALRVMQAEIAAGQGDIAALQAVHAERMVVHYSPLGGDTIGRDALYTQNKIMFERGEGTLKLTPYHVVGNDDTVLVVAKVTGQRDDKILDQVVLEVWRMEAGQCVEVWDYFSDQPSWNEFWQ